jgi:limonene 1,2-monooxygenase
MRFGVFLVPFHLPNSQNPTYALRRDVESCKLYDRLGFDEVWFGEHHSGGCEIIPDPITMIAHVAPQTERIKSAPASSRSPTTTPSGRPSG